MTAVAVGRLGRLRRRLSRRRIGCFAIASRSNLAYLTQAAGLFGEGFTGMGVVEPDRATLFTDARYGEQARAQAAGTPWDVRVSKRSVTASVCQAVAGCSEDMSVAVEPDVSHRTYRVLSEALGRPLEAVGGLVEALRRVKDPAEIEAIEKAARIVDAVFAEALGLIQPGVAERELALELEYRMRKKGAERVAFPPIVASGPNGSKPHAEASVRRIEAGDLVTIDMGAVFGGYCSDMTRTVAVGSIDEERKAVYGRVLEAQKRAMGTIRAGAIARDVDVAARRSLADAGLATHFTHGVGHGVGLDVHELPTLNARTRCRLLADDVVTVEPGVYLEGRFGVRIEDLVVVKPDGVHNLTHSPKHLIAV